MNAFFFIFLILPFCNGNVERQRRQVIQNNNKTGLWPTTNIPFVIEASVFDSPYSKTLLHNIYSAFTVIQRLTCLSFDDNSYKSEKVRKNIVNDSITVKYSSNPNDFCNAHPGYQVYGPTIVTISEQCATDPLTLVHEIMHILGVLHVQMRKDRNDYIYVFERAIPRALKSQFEIVPDARYFDVPYNPGSIMHYAPKVLKKNNRTPYFGPIDDSKLVNSFSNNRLTYTDIALLNLAYQCPSTCGEDANDRCAVNSGIPDSRFCDSCICPDAFQGPECTDRAELKVNGTVCGATLEAGEDWKTLNEYFDTDGGCVWHIRAPVETTIVIAFKNIHTNQTDENKNGHCEENCIDGYLEIQTDNFEVAGIRYCCYNDIVKEPYIFEPNGLVVLLTSFTKPFGFELLYTYI